MSLGTLGELVTLVCIYVLISRVTFCVHEQSIVDVFLADYSNNQPLSINNFIFRTFNF